MAIYDRYSKRICICLGGAIAGNSSEGKQISRRMQKNQKKFMNMEVATNFKAVKLV